MIDAYSFGSITIDGIQYSKDVMISHTGVLSPWWRKDGHSLSPDDLGEALKKQPDILIIGTGSFGVMKVPSDTLGFLKERKIDARVMRTGKAVEEFNSLLKEQGPEKVAAALHLTC